MFTYQRERSYEEDRIRRPTSALGKAVRPLTGPCSDSNVPLACGLRRDALGTIRPCKGNLNPLFRVRDCCRLFALGLMNLAFSLRGVGSLHPLDGLIKRGSSNLLGVICFELRRLETAIQHLRDEDRSDLIRGYAFVLSELEKMLEETVPGRGFWLQRSSTKRN